ncbi:MAG: ACP S-malonyltransferase, partial [Desulfovibrionaceae bacterium]
MPEPRPTFAVTFPGQGSQQPGMARALLERCPAARTLLAGLSDAAGEDLVRLAADPDVPAEDLARPRAAHLALVATGLACWRALRQDPEFAPEAAPDLAPDSPPCSPRFLAGHSLGEITALACAGALPPDQALALAARRGELLETAAAERPGGMAAIVGPAPEAVEAACAEAMARVPEGELVAAVNYNTPTQTVIAGSPAALAAAEAACARQGARVVRLPVAAAFHTPLVGGAAAPLYDFARTLDWREP